MSDFLKRCVFSALGIMLMSVGAFAGWQPSYQISFSRVSGSHNYSLYPTITSDQMIYESLSDLVDGHPLTGDTLESNFFVELPRVFCGSNTSFSCNGITDLTLTVEISAFSNESAIPMPLATRTYSSGVLNLEKGPARLFFRLSDLLNAASMASRNAYTLELKMFVSETGRSNMTFYQSAQLIDIGFP